MKNHHKKRPTRAREITAPTEPAGAEKYDLKKLGLMPGEFKIAEPRNLSIKILELIQNELVDEASDQPVLVKTGSAGGSR